jgi:RNA polymerase sigma factor (sigma-70 family)
MRISSIEKYGKLIVGRHSHAATILQTCFNWRLYKPALLLYVERCASLHRKKAVLNKTQTISKINEPTPVGAVRQDRGKFEELYQFYVHRIFRYHYSRVGDQQVAEDLTAQTFLAALETFDHFREGGCIAAWLFGIARNKAIDHYRKRIIVDPLDEVTLSSVENDPLTGIIHSERRAVLAGLIRALPENERELLRLRYLGEMSFDEIGHALRRNADAVKKTLYRLLQRLQRQLESTND